MTNGLVHVHSRNAGGRRRGRNVGKTRRSRRHRHAGSTSRSAAVTKACRRHTRRPDGRLVVVEHGLVMDGGLMLLLLLLTGVTVPRRLLHRLLDRSLVVLFIVVSSQPRRSRGLRGGCGSVPRRELGRRVGRVAEVAVVSLKVVSVSVVHVLLVVLLLVVLPLVVGLVEPASVKSIKRPSSLTHGLSHVDGSSVGASNSRGQFGHVVSVGGLSNRLLLSRSIDDALSLELSHQGVVLSVSVFRSAGVGALLQTISSKMALGATNVADDRRHEVVSSLVSVVHLVSRGGLRSASVVLVVSKGTVKGSQFSQLGPLELILALRHAGGGVDDLLDQLDCSSNLLLVLGDNQTVEIVLGGGLEGDISPALSLLDTASASNTDFGSRFLLHLLESLSSGSQQLADKVDVRVLVDGNVDHLLGLCGLVVVHGGSVVGNQSLGPLDESVALLLQLSCVSSVPCVGSLSHGIILRRWRRRPLVLRRHDISQPKLLADLLNAIIDGVRLGLFGCQVAS